MPPARTFFRHTCDIERATISAVDGANRGQKVSEWGSVATGVECWFEPQGAVQVLDDMMGKVPLETWNVWFDGGQDVAINDRLVRDSVTYEVTSVLDYSDTPSFHKVAVAEKKNYAQPTS